MQSATQTRKTGVLSTRSRRTASSLFAAAIAAGLSAASAFAQGYYPQVDSPVTGNPELAQIEARLESGVTLALPPAAGKTIATNTQLAAAVALAVEDELSDELSDGIPGVTAVSLIREAAQYRPAKASIVIGQAVPILVALGGANVDQLLEDSVGAAALASGKGAPGVAAAAIKAIIKDAEITAAGEGGIDDIAAAAIAASQQYAAKTTAAAIKATKGGTATLAAEIATAAIQTAISSGGSFLVEEITKSAVSSTRAIRGQVENTTAAILDASALSGFSSTDDVVQLIAAAMSGAGKDNAEVLNTLLDTKYAGDEIKLTSSKAAISGFVQAQAGEQEVAPATIAAFIAASTDNANEAAAITAGAVAGAPKFAREVVAAAMKAAFLNTSDDSQGSIVGAGIRALPTATSKITTAAINQAEVLAADGIGYTAELGAIVDAAVRNTTIALAGSAAYSAIRALDRPETLDAGYELNVRALTAAAITGAEGADYGKAIGDITFRLAKGNKKLSTVIVEEVIQTVSIDSDPLKVAAAVAGAIAADKKNAGLVFSAALAARADDDDALITAAADVAQAIIAAPRDFFRITNENLETATNLDEALAVVHGASMLNPKGSVAIAATALANSSASVEAILNATSSASWKLVPRVTVALEVASYVKGNSGADLFEYVRDQVLQKASFAADIATGAVAVAPQYAHVTAHAVAFQAPTIARKAVPALFAFSKLDTLKVGGSAPDQPARAAAIMAGLASGIMESGIVETKRNSAIRLAVVAAVKASLTLTGPLLQQSTGVAGESESKATRGPAGVITGYVAQVADVGVTDIQAATVGAVLTAVGKVAKWHVLEIAQAAATAAAILSGAPGSFVGAEIVQALSNPKAKYSTAEIAAAVAFGIQQAVDNIAGAGAAGVVAKMVDGKLQYTHSRVTGDPVTSIYEL